MMRKGKRKSATAYLAAAVILACYLAQTIDCFRLRKTERREGQKDAGAAKTIAVKEGTIVFGRLFHKGSGLESEVIDGTRRSSSNSSVEDEATYQADFAGWPRGLAYDATSREASWKRMSPSLQCGGDQLKFRAVGPGASQFSVEQGNAYPVPLSQVPSTCGYNMQRNSLALVMHVPYDGCNMVQEGGSYVLPMRWQGIPVSLWCPKPAAPAHTTAAPQQPQLPQHSKNPDASHPQIPQSFFYPHYLPYPQYTPGVVPHPTTATTTTISTTKKPAMPQIPQYPPFYPLYPYFPPPPPVTPAPTSTTTKATTTTTTATTTKKPEMPMFPQYPPFFPLYPYFPPPIPVTPVPTTTTTTTTTTAAPTTTQTTTTATTTAKPPASAPPPAPPPMFPFPVYPQYVPFPWPFPGPLPATAKPPVFPPYPFFPPPIPPFPQYPTPKPATTTPSTTTTTTTTTKKTNPPLTKFPGNFQHLHPHFHLPVPFIQYPPPFPLPV